MIIYSCKHTYVHDRYISRTLDDIITPSGSQSSSRAMQQCYDVQPSGVLDSLEQAYDSLSREVNNTANIAPILNY
jgi:hypothetical protein